jgi:hypothetical protein
MRHAFLIGAHGGRIIAADKSQRGKKKKLLSVGVFFLCRNACWVYLYVTRGACRAWYCAIGRCSLRAISPMAEKPRVSCGQERCCQRRKFGGAATINRFRLLSIQVASSHCATRIPMGRISRGVEKSGTKDGARNLPAYLVMRRKLLGLIF